MAHNRSTLLASDPVVTNRFPVSTIGTAPADQLISELLVWGTPHLPAHVSDFQSLMSHVVKLAKIVTGATGSAIALRGEQGTICRARWGDGAPALGALVDTGTGISKQCLDSGMSLRCEDIATDERVDSEFRHAAGIRAVAVVPIYNDGARWGILEVFSGTPGVFHNQHLRRLEILANWLGSAVLIASEKLSDASSSGAQIAVPLPISHSPVIVNLSPGWNDVFVDSHVPWKRFVQSVFLHILAVGILSGISRIYPRELLLSPPSIHETHVTYFPFSQSFPRRETRGQLIAPRRPQTPVEQRTNHESKPGDSDVQAAKQASTTHPLTATIPAMPIFSSSPRHERRFEVENPVAPSPDVEGANSRRPSSLGASIIGPTPVLSDAAGERRLNTPGTAVIAPPPEAPVSEVKAGQGRGGRIENSSATAPELSIVQPPPAMNDAPLLSYGPIASSAESGEQVVAPPPSVHSLTKLGAGGTSLSWGESVSNVVPPPPSLQGGSALGARGRARTAGAGNSQVAPPPPSMQSERNYNARTVNNALPYAGSQVVPPPPSLPGGGGDSSGTAARANSPARPGDGIGLPPASSSTAFKSNPAGSKVGSDTANGPSVPRANQDAVTMAVQELPVRLIGLAWAPARSSYFSNFEVFLAERWLDKEEPEFIKLVYVFLPYQERLSEYGFDSKVRKLRVTRDPSCDEKAPQIISPQDGNSPRGAPSADALKSISRNHDNMLPCYRTTADDYRRAITRHK